MNQRLKQLAADIKQWALELGFQNVGITDTDLSPYVPHFQRSLNHPLHGEMAFLSKNPEKRLNPSKLVPGTIRVISVSLNYFSPTQNKSISQHAKGGGYHQLIRKRLQKLADKITKAAGVVIYRAFSDSAPVLEKALAEKAGIGWIGKNTLLINRQAGSWFFLGELFVNLPLPLDTSAKNHCGSCKKCIAACPTGALTAPYQLEAKKCISYLTIEHKGSLPEALRSQIGSKIFGCDICQDVCPWNKTVTKTHEPSFMPNQNFEVADCLNWFSWSEMEFLEKTKNSEIKRLGYERWLRNLAVALGNAAPSEKIKRALQFRLKNASALVSEHIQWALEKFI